jgi:hypothetical protein
MTYITTLDKPHEQHRSKIIIHRESQFYSADFNNIKQLDLFAETLGFTYNLVEEKPFLGDNTNIYRRYEMSRNIKNALYYFWKKEDIPEDARPIKALSNGSIVTCYFTNDGENITIYRPNPNATLENKNRYKTQEEYEKAVANRVYYPNSLEFEAVYNPLSLAEQIAHHKTYGSY